MTLPENKQRSRIIAVTEPTTLVKTLGTLAPENEASSLHPSPSVQC